MKIQFNLWVIFFLLQVLSVEEGIAQRSPFQSYDSSSMFRFGIRYTSDYYYMGRADSAKAPYMTPSIGYYHKSGLFLRSTLSYLTSSEDSRVDLITFSGGYDYFGKKLAIGVSVTQYLFSDLSYTVQSEMSSYFNSYLGYDVAGVMLYADASLALSEDADVFLGAEINKTFYAMKRRLQIVPAIYFNAGTQNYYQEYYTQRSAQTGSGKGKGNHHGTQQPPVTQQLHITTSSKFQILDYETEMQVIYKIGKLRLFASSTWVFPVNPATVVTETGSYVEELNNGFFWSTGFRITLAGKN